MHGSCFSLCEGDKAPGRDYTMSPKTTVQSHGNFMVARVNRT